MDDEVTQEWAESVIQYCLKQKNLHKKVMWTLMLRAKDKLEKLKTCNQIEVGTGNKFTICGDIHGQY